MEFRNPISYGKGMNKKGIRRLSPMCCSKFILLAWLLASAPVSAIFRKPNLVARNGNSGNSDFLRRTLCSCERMDLPLWASSDFIDFQQ